MHTDRWKDVERIFNRALDEEPGARTAFLEAECAGDDELRDEVLSLLRYEKAASRFIETPAIEGLAAEIGEADEPLPTGCRVGPYRVVSLLGEGGMGEVYRARDGKLGREVALKAVPASFALDLDRVRRLEREARVLASLSHPNVAAIYGIEEALGMQFLVLELVEGETLADRLKRGPVPLDQTLRIALQIARALGAAHAAGVVHRDLKPANIRVTPDGHVKVLDFGLAKALSAGDPEPDGEHGPGAAGDTRHGMILGTPAYMSPEQIRGEEVDARTDIWALGCIFYEMLTGHPVWTGDSMNALRRAVETGAPDLIRLPAGAGPELAGLIRRCLEKEAARRLSGAGQVERGLVRMLSPRGVAFQPRPPWTPAGVGLGILAAASVWGLFKGMRALTGTNDPPPACPDCGMPLGCHVCGDADRRA